MNVRKKARTALLNPGFFDWKTPLAYTFLAFLGKILRFSTVYSPLPLLPKNRTF